MGEREARWIAVGDPEVDRVDAERPRLERKLTVELDDCTVLSVEPVTTRRMSLIGASFSG